MSRREPRLLGQMGLVFDMAPHCSPGVSDGVIVKTARPPRKQSERSIAMKGGGDGGGCGGDGGGGGGSGLVGTHVMYGIEWNLCRSNARRRSLWPDTSASR